MNNNEVVDLICENILFGDYPANVPGDLSRVIQKIWDEACEAQNKANKDAVGRVRKQVEESIVPSFAPRGHVPYIVGPKPPFEIDSI
jgi:hypothetical protein